MDDFYGFSWMAEWEWGYLWGKGGSNLGKRWGSGLGCIRGSMSFMENMFFFVLILLEKLINKWISFSFVILMAKIN